MTSFVADKIKAMRMQALSAPSTLSTSAPASTTTYQNVSVVRANSMKFLPNYFTKGQLRSLFFCFPDPHFKQRKHKARIVSAALAAEYAFSLAPGGVVYTITDVLDLHEWMRRHFDGCALFERLLVRRGGEAVGEEGEMTEEERDCVRMIAEETEEGKKVSRNGGSKYVACWRRREDPEWPE